MTVPKNRGPFLYRSHPVPNLWRGSKLQDVVDGLEGPTDCDVARPSIATDQSTILSTGGMVKARSSLHWPIADLSEWINGSQSRSGGHEGQCTTTVHLDVKPSPKGVLSVPLAGQCLGRPFRSRALATTPPTIYSNAPIGGDISTS